MPFPAWHRKRPSGAERRLYSLVFMYAVVIILVAAVLSLSIVLISKASRQRGNYV